MKKDEAVALAVDSMLRDGLSDITTESLEIKLLQRYRADFEADIKAKLNRGNVNEMEFRSLQYLLTPKNRYVFDYRKAAIISPSCMAKYASIVLQYADVIEAARVPVSKNIVFSCRFSPNKESIFSKEVGYSEWREETKKRAQADNCQFVVSCDIAAFYDRVNIHRIESTLLSIGVDKRLVNHTNELLLFWSKKDSYGIPVGNVASRILAEAALIDVDQHLLSEGIEFTRYVDDYRLFAPNLLIAQEWMNKLTTRLFRDGLMLNTGKTQIRKSEKNTDESEVTKEQSTEAVLKVVTKLTGGYNRIARKFIMPAEEKHEVFKKIKIEEELKLFGDGDIFEFSGIQKVVIAALVQQRFDLLIRVAELCCQYLYALDYFVDMLIKNADFIPAIEKNKIADMYATQIEEGNLYAFEWHCATLARLMSHDSYSRKNALLKIYISPAKDVSSYASMIALDGLAGKLTRSEFKTIREYFDRCDEWERRRLLMLSSSLPLDERKAWGKAVKPIVANDFLNAKLCDEVVAGVSINIED